LLERSVIILAGGSSERFGEHKAFAELAGRPLISYIFEKVQGVSDEVLIVASSEDQTEPFSRLFGNKVKVVVDKRDVRSPLVGALTGFENALGRYSLLLPCDVPFVSKEIVRLLFDICVDVEAVIPRWPNSYIEPLHSVYWTESGLHAAKMALSNNRMNMESMIRFLKRVRYISTIALKQFDPQLNTFFNINTKLDLKKAEQIKASRASTRDSR